MSSVKQKPNGLPSPISTGKSSPINDTPLHRFLPLATIKLLKHQSPYDFQTALYQVRSSYTLVRSFHNALHSCTHLYPCTKSLLRLHTSRLDLHCYGEDRRRYNWQRMDILQRRIKGKRPITSQADGPRDAEHPAYRCRHRKCRQRIFIRRSGGWYLITVRAFPATLRIFISIYDVGMEFHPDLYPEVNELIAQHEEPYPSLVFTHGDLSSLNILACGDKVVGIVDWEIAGWYPSYWEYTTACQVNPHNSFWRDEIEKFLNPFPKELAMEKLRQKYFGDV